MEAAQARIEELGGAASEAPLQNRGGFLGKPLRLLSTTASRTGSVPRISRPGGAAPQQPIPAATQAQRGGGFLAGAAQTAMGVAGGVLLANAIGGMFGNGGEAQAAEVPDEELQSDDSGFDDGGDFGDMDF